MLNHLDYNYHAHVACKEVGSCNITIETRAFFIHSSLLYLHLIYKEKQKNLFRIIYVFPLLSLSTYIMKVLIDC